MYPVGDSEILPELWTKYRRILFKIYTSYYLAKVVDDIIVLEVINTEEIKMASLHGADCFWDSNSLSDL